MKKVICNEEIPVSDKSENTNTLPIDDKDDSRFFIKEDEDIDMKVPTNNQEKQYGNSSQPSEEKEEKIEIIDNTKDNDEMLIVSRKYLKDIKNVFRR